MANLSGVFKVFLRILGAVGGSFFIGYLGWVVIRGWFGGQGPANLGSIEVSYVSMGRFLVDYGWKSWAPFWYFGFPFHMFYTPLLPVLEWLLHVRCGMQLWEAYRWITGWAYILAPISVFFLGWVLSRRWIGGLVSGIFYSIGPTLFYFLESEVRGDRFSPTAGGFLDPRRFVILVRWGEGPHLVSLVFLPLLGVFLVEFWRRKRFWLLVASAVMLVAAALANALGLMGAMVLIGSIVFVWYAQHPKEHSQTVKWTIVYGLMCLGLVSFWYNLSFLGTFFAEGGTTKGMIISLFPWGWVLGALMIGGLYVVFSKFLKDFGVAVASIWFLALFTVVYVYYKSSDLPSQRIELLPQALRFMTQVDLAFSILVGTVLGWVLRKVGQRFILGELLLTVFATAILLISFAYVQPFLPISFEASSKVIDLSTSRERVIADWLSSHVDTTKGERVFLPGNYGFYLNWFSDVWQHRGGLFQASTHYWPDHIHYQMANGEDGEIAEAWLKAMNAKYAVVTGSASSELYREMKHLERFEDYKKVYFEGGDMIYEVPLVRPSPAKPVNIEAMRGIVTPTKADDKPALLDYVEWVERSSPYELAFKMLNHDRYSIRGYLDSGESVLVQMTADPGWKAVIRKSADQDKLERIRMGRDPLGFLLLYPDLPAGGGEVEIILWHGPTWKIWLGYVMTAATFMLIVGYTLRRYQAARKGDITRN